MDVRICVDLSPRRAPTSRNRAGTRAMMAGLHGRAPPALIHIGEKMKIAGIFDQLVVPSQFGLRCRGVQVQEARTLAQLSDLHRKNSQARHFSVPRANRFNRRSQTLFVQERWKAAFQSLVHEHTHMSKVKLSTPEYRYAAR